MSDNKPDKSFDQKLADIRSRNEEEDYSETAEDTASYGKGHNAAGEFLASVIAGGLLGYAIDRYFETSPWGLFFFICLGFVSAAIRATKAATKDD